MFNPQARWDRRLPGHRDSPYPEEAVTVVARVAQGKVIPLSFIRDASSYEISRINYEWRERNGRDLLYYFSVASGDDAYCLYLSKETMSWRLRQLE